MKSENINLSSIEIIDQYLKESNEAKTLEDIINHVSHLKAFDAQDIETINQLYLDMTSSGKYVYLGDNKWDLKERNLEYWDKEGIAFVSEEERANLEDIEDEDDIDFADFDYNQYQQKIQSMQEQAIEDVEDIVDEEIEDTEVKEEKEYLDIELPIDQDDDVNEDYDFSYDEDFNKDEDKYNDLMDEFEGLYEDK